MLQGVQISLPLFFLLHPLYLPSKSLGTHSFLILSSYTILQARSHLRALTESSQAACLLEFFSRVHRKQLGPRLPDRPSMGLLSHEQFNVDGMFAHLPYAFVCAAQWAMEHIRFFCGQWPGLGSSYPCSNVVKLRGVSEDSVNSEDPYVHLSVFRALTVYGPCT